MSLASELFHTDNIELNRALEEAVDSGECQSFENVFKRRALYVFKDASFIMYKNCAYTLHEDFSNF